MKGKWIAASVLIVALLGIAVLIVYTILAGASAVNLGDFRLEINGTSAFSAKTDEEQRIEVGDTPNLVVDDTSGDITILSGKAGEILISAHKTAYADSQKKAESDLEALDVQISQQGDTVAVQVRQPTSVICMGFCRPDTVDFAITVPEGTEVKATTDSGNVSTSGTGGEAHLFSNYGNIRAEQLEGTLEARTDSGSVEVQNVHGGIVILNSDYGDVTLSQADAEQVLVTTQSGKISLTDVEASGDVALEDSYGNVTFESGSAAVLTVNASSGAVTLNDLTVSTVTAHSDYGDVRVSGVSAQTYDLSSNSGIVSADGVRGKVRVQDDYGNIIIRNAEEATLDLDTNSGDVKFYGSLGAGPHRLHSDYGDILLVIPESTALSFDLQTDYGSIASAIPVTINGKIDEDHWVGTVNGGGASLTATTNSGNVRIEILNP